MKVLLLNPPLEERNKKIVELWNSGKTNDEIKKEFNLSIWVIREILESDSNTKSFLCKCKSKCGLYAKPGRDCIYGHNKHRLKEIAKETKIKIGRAGKKRWNSWSLEKQTRFLQNSLYRGSRSPNVSESKIFKVIKSLGFKYNGRGPIRIAGKIPDYVNTLFPKLLIEYDGERGHRLDLISTLPRNKHQLDDQRDAGYRKVGYNILRILPKDKKKGRRFVFNKVKNWMESLGCKI